MTLKLVKDTFTPPEYNSPEEFRKKAEKYFERLHTWLDANPNHNVEFYKDPEHNHYIGYGTLRKGWEIRQPEIDRLKARIEELEVAVDTAISIAEGRDESNTDN